MTKRNKILFALLLVIGAVIAIFVSQFSLHSSLEKRIAEMLEGQGLSEAAVSISEMDKQHIAFSEISFSKDALHYHLKNVKILATNLPVMELLRGHYEQLALEWSMEAIQLSGMPYAVPPFSAKGQYQNMELSAVLKVQKLPVQLLLSILSNSQASASGFLSGTVALRVDRHGVMRFQNGRLATEQEGKMQLSPELLPGDAMQMEMARTALANFHYKELSLQLETGKHGKPMIQLKLEGNNPNAFSGRTVKLQVNFSGDLLETLEQTMLPIRHPDTLIKKDSE